MSKPATRAVPEVGGQKSREHVHRRRFPGAVRPQEAVDLAWRDAQVDAVDGGDVALEGPNEALGLDPVLRAHASISTA
jgi:hypothetical protein